MRTTSTLLTIALLICMTAAGTMAADFAGPRLEGTVTLRSGQTISGLILTAQLGIVDGAEIGSRLSDGGYIAVTKDGQERRVQATDIAAIDVEWSQTGTAEDPKWKITKLTVTTKSGEAVTGKPAWLVHATSLIVEQEDGTQKKIYAFPMAGSNFSPDNLMTALSFGEASAPATGETPETTEQPETAVAPETPETGEAEGEEPETGEAPTGPETGTPGTPATGEITPIEQPEDVGEADEGEAEAATGEAEGATGPETAISVTAQPTVESVPEGSVFASGQPAVITFEMTNPETGKPMQVRFLIVPLPAGQ